MDDIFQSQKDSNFSVFCHPDVRTENAQGKGRSLKATKRIEPGTRLVSEVPATAVAQSDAAALDKVVKLIVSSSERFAGLCTLPVSPGPGNRDGSGSKVAAADECSGAHEKVINSIIKLRTSLLRLQWTLELMVLYAALLMCRRAAKQRQMRSARPLPQGIASCRCFQ